MNVASLELCKELYELSGWESEYQYMADGGLAHYTWSGVPQTLDYPPAYDCGSLLRKLPTSLKGPRRLLLAPDDKPKSWRAQYGVLYVVKAATPQDAAAKLAIELFKRGVLTRESK